MRESRTLFHHSSFIIHHFFVIHHLFMNGERVLIPLAIIDDRPGPYTMSFGYDPGPMVESVRRVGLLNPPLVDRDKEGRVVIVAGYRRLMALRTLGEEKVHCVDLSGSGLTTGEKLLIALYDNVASRGFNGAEKAMVLERLTDHFKEEDVVSLYMPLLGLPAHRPTLNAYVRLNELESEMRIAFAEGRLSFRSVRTLLEMDSSSRAACFKWLSNLTFNFNQQSQFLEIIIELSSSMGKTIPDLLQEDPLPDLLLDGGLNGPRKVKSTLDHLRSKRMPNLSRAEKRFQEMTRSLGLPEGVSLQHAPYFEAPDYRLELRFRDGKGLREKVLALAGNERLERIRDPWKIGEE